MRSRAREDPQRRRRRSPRDGQDVPRRGAAVPDRRGQPARNDRGGTTVSDWDEDEHKRADVDLAVGLHAQPGRSARSTSIDVPGDPSFQGESRTALRVVEGALVVVSAVMGVEVGTARSWKLRRRARARAGRLREHARPRARRLLPRAAAAAGAALGAVRRRAPPDRSRARAHRDRRRAPHVRVHEPGGWQGGRVRARSRTSWSEPAQEYREKLLDAVVETDEALMERYLEGEELDPHDVASALKAAMTRGEVFPVACGVATKNLGTHALLDLIVEGVPSPAKKGAPIDVDGAATGGSRLQDDRRPVRRQDQPLPRPQGHGRPPTRRS